MIRVCPSFERMIKPEETRRSLEMIFTFKLKKEDRNVILSQKNFLLSIP
jgi:hypothetical protein